MSLLLKCLFLFVPDATKRNTRRSLQRFFFSGLVKVSRSKENALLWSHGQFELSPYILLRGFTQGFFPLPNMRNHKIIEWYDPEIRGIIPIRNFKAQQGLLRLLKKEKLRESDDKQFDIRINTDFEGTIIACSKPRDKKAITWLSAEYIKSALELHKMGIAHSVEAYENGDLVGGVIGVAINGYFSTLSLFHTVDNASKVAFYYLLVKLKNEGFQLHDFGSPNPWVSQFGMLPVPRSDFRNELMKAITRPVIFTDKVPELEFTQ